MGVSLSKNADFKVLYNRFSDVLGDQLENYEEWSKLQFGTALGLGKIAIDTTSDMWHEIKNYSNSVFSDGSGVAFDPVLYGDSFSCTFSYPAQGSSYFTSNSFVLKYGDVVYDFYVKTWVQRDFSADDVYVGNDIFVNGKKIGYYTRTSCIVQEGYHNNPLILDLSLAMVNDKLAVVFPSYKNGVCVSTDYFYLQDFGIPSSYDQEYYNIPYTKEVLGDGSICVDMNINPSLLKLDDVATKVGDTLVYNGTLDDFVSTVDDTPICADTVLDYISGQPISVVNTSVSSVPANISSDTITWDSVGTVDMPIDTPVDYPWLDKMFGSGTLELDFSPLYNISFADRFPFCIPFDFVKSVKMFSQQAKDPDFTIDLDTRFFSVHHTIDFSPFMFYVSFFRYVVCIWFIFILIFKTRDLMKW